MDISDSLQFHSIEDYISSQPEEFRANLKVIRQVVRKTVPDAKEVISYQMPAFKYHGMLCFFAVFKDHYSLFVSPAVREAFSGRLKSYKTTKSAIHFPFGQPVPVTLIGEIIRYAAIANLEKAEVKKHKK